MRINNFDEATKQLQLHLNEYLEEQGLDTKRNFKCLNPAHVDSTPSMSVVRPDSIRVYCHGCAIAGDIFDVCAWLEKKPLTGQGFMTETLPYLAKKFSVELEHTELTEDEQYQLDTYRAYRHALEYITAWNGNIPADVQAELDRRNWSDIKLLRESGTGYVEDPVAFRSHLKGLGFSASFLDDVDLGRKDIFSPGHLIFTIKDESGRPVGFAARDLNWVKGNGPKYVNQKTTGVKCNIYQKGKRLYGFDHAVKFKNDGPLYIMEGYPDVLSCHLNSFGRAIATCGTSVTDDHLLLLKEHGVYDIVLCYDADTAGQERTEALLDSKFANHRDINVNILTVPSGKDPDDFIRENGIEAFKALKPVTAFQWRLYRFDESVEQEIICKKMMSFILSEPSHISQEKMIQELARFTGFNVKTLQAELQRLVNDKEKTKGRERDLIIDKMHKEISSRPDDAEVILSEVQTKLYGLKVKYDEDSMSEDSTLKFLLDIKNREETDENKQLGFYLGEDLREYQNALLGDWKDTMQVFGGKANCFAKSTLFLDPVTGLFVTAEKLSHTASTCVDMKSTEVSPVDDYIESGMQECFKVTNTLGQSVLTTMAHRYLTKNGWKRLSELKVGDTIAAPSKMPHAQVIKDTVSSERALFLGLMLGDGSINQSRPHFTNDDPVILTKIKDIVVQEWGSNIQTPIYLSGKNGNLTYEEIGFTQKDWKTSRDNKGRCFPNPITSWLKEIGLYGKTAENKFIPNFIFQEKLCVVRQLLVGLFSTDGSIYNNASKTRTSIEYSSISKLLIDQIQHLLLRFGIVSAVRKKINKLNQESYLLSIRDQTGVQRFVERVGFLGRKSTVPVYSNTKYLKSSYDKDIFWTTIKEITPVGIQDTCDITVNQTSCFNLDGFVLHNSGKTSFLVKLGYEIARHEKENDACVIYHTIDDSAEQLLPKWICVAEGSTQLEINHVKNPNHWKDKTPDWEGLMLRREQGYQTITRLIREGRLVIKDATHGTSLAYAESLIKYYTEKYRNRRIVYILDNFHKIRDFEGLDERIKFKTASQQVKYLAVKYHISILSTMEYTKLPAGVKPTNDNIAETVQMEYDANLIAHLWNGMHELGDRAGVDMFHTTLGPNGPERKPVVEINIGKNKINSFKSKLYLKFFPASSDYKQQPLEVALALQAEAEQRGRENKRSRDNRPVVANIFDG